MGPTSLMFIQPVSVIERMELWSKGAHRALVPMDSQMENVSPVGVELVESASSHRMFTQMDVLRFMKEHSADRELQSVPSRSVHQLAAINHDVYAITDRTKLIDAIKCLKTAMLNAVPIVTSSDSVDQQDHNHLVHGRGRKLIGTFFATDLRGCYVVTLKSWLGMSARAFTEEVGTNPLYSPNNNAAATWKRELVTCQAESPLSEVIEKAVGKHVHRVWAVDQDGLLVGLVSLTDVIRVIGLSLVSD
ncbi:SNF1-related protein kinase regulatory subunit gamma-like PV42a [Neltuma alba]|uniref:SNF1-related protein kinase regulatory subunit gamma-like PV42a n=1 Tax=Neltuma alba TaxID=207710 RepID=UPI0010A42DAA|nr:SNF1-related protein kinase regulatory subunit gamma-like PV42a [Prosopis alba]